MCNKYIPVAAALQHLPLYITLLGREYKQAAYGGVAILLIGAIQQASFILSGLVDIRSAAIIVAADMVSEN